MSTFTFLTITTSSSKRTSNFSEKELAYFERRRYVELQRLISSISPTFYVHSFEAFKGSSSVSRFTFNFLAHGVNFTNVLRAAFTRADPKSAKKTVKLSSFFALLGSASVKAARRTLVKLNPGILICRERFISHLICGAILLRFPNLPNHRTLSRAGVSHFT